jgi:hypothetical protein
MNKQSEGTSRKANPVLDHLAPLVGEWDMVGTHPFFPSALHGHSSFEWLEGEALLSWHFVFEQPGPPRAISVIGADDALETYHILYCDERGVSRIYETSLEDGVWRFWRKAPGFSQRFTGTFSDDGNTITGHGELSRDGSTWEPDLDVTYTKIR